MVAPSNSMDPGQDLFSAARMCLEQGRIHEAIAMFGQCLKLDPERADLHFFLGYSFHLGNDLDRAIECYGRALAIDPGLADAFHNLGQARFAQGRPAEAVDNYQQAIALDCSPDYFFSLGQAYQEQSLFDDAAHAFRNALTIAPRDAECHCWLGMALQALGDLTGAEACFERSLALDPGQLDTYYLLGQLLLDQDRFEEARRVYQDSLALDPNRDGVWIILAELNTALDIPEEAVLCYRRALAINPHQADALNNSAAIYRSLGRLDEAEAGFRQALTINPGLAEARANLGQVLFIRKNYVEAENNLRQALDLKPELAEPRALLGVIFRNQGKIREAVSCFRLSLAHDNKSPDVHYNLALALLSLEKYYEAVSEFQMVLNLAPGFPQMADLTKNFGIALYRAGYLKAACPALGRALALAPEDVEIKGILREVIIRKKEIERLVRIFNQRPKPGTSPEASDHASTKIDEMKDLDTLVESAVERATDDISRNGLLTPGHLNVRGESGRDFMYNLILNDFPDFGRPGLEDLEVVTILRRFTYQNIIEAYDLSVCLDTDPSFNYASRQAPEIFQAFREDRGGVWCGGAARAYYRLCRMFGFKCFMINLGNLVGGLSHVTTVVEINHHGRGMLVVQDPYLNTAFRDSSRQPIDYLDLLSILSRRDHDLIVPEDIENQTRYYLVPAEFEPEVAGTWHFRRDGSLAQPVDRLADGTLKYIVRPSAGLLLETNSELQHFLSEKGHPVNILYFFLYPSAVYGEHDVKYLADRITESLDGGAYEIQKAVLASPGKAYLHR